MSEQRFHFTVSRDDGAITATVSITADTLAKAVSVLRSKFAPGTFDIYRAYVEQLEMVKRPLRGGDRIALDALWAGESTPAKVSALVE